MKVWQIQDEFGLDHLLQAERPDPRPGPGQVLVQVHASSLNFRDLMMIEGLYNPRQKLPLVPNSDGAGEVVEVGKGVTRFKVGDRVAGIFAQKWLAGAPEYHNIRGSTLGGPLDGMLAEYRVLDEDGLVHIPAHLDYQEAASLPCAAVTAWNALFVQGNVKAGDTVLLLGTGGVSLFGLQFAQMAGARAIITSSSDEKLERVRKLGAWETINYKTTPEWDRRVLELTGMGADHVVEVGGAGTLARSINAVTLGGTVTVIGVLSGTATELDVRSLLMKSVRLQGLFVGNRRMFEDMNRAIAQHEMKPVIDRAFNFNQAPQAYKHMGGGKHFGKIAIQVRI